MIHSADRAQTLLFLEVPDEHAPGEPIHVDLRAVGCTRDEEVARPLAIGARRAADRVEPDGRGWAALADPEATSCSSAQRRRAGGCLLATGWR
jgi:hypothetical protein